MNELLQVSWCVGLMGMLASLVEIALGFGDSEHLAASMLVFAAISLLYSWELEKERDERHRRRRK